MPCGIVGTGVIEAARDGGFKFGCNGGKKLNKRCVRAVNALNAYADAILAVQGDDRPFNNLWGWNMPPINRHEFANLHRTLAIRIDQLDEAEISPELDTLLAGVPERLENLKTQSLPNLASGNAVHVVAQSIQYLDLIGSHLPARVSWEKIDKSTLPHSLVRRLKSVESQLTALEPRTEKLADQIRDIDAAHATAESLPTDLAALQESRDSVETAQKATEAAKVRADAALASALEVMKRINESDVSAAKVVANCEEAYRISTSRGLAAAFDQRAARLSASVIWWVFGLIVALAVAGFLAYLRISDVQSLLSSSEAERSIWLNIVVSVLSLAAPVWFAWLATKQIGQRFRLAEDYAYKASVAKAYEGYRREAVNIDGLFVERLFGSALTRLEEAPLRLVEQESYGSPWHELTNSVAFKRAAEAFPDLRTLYSHLKSKTNRRAAPHAVAAQEPLVAVVKEEAELAKQA